MSGRRKNRKRNARSRAKTSAPHPPASPPRFPKWLWPTVGIGASGFIFVFAGWVNDFINKGLQLSYSQSVGSAYELVMTNTGPTDRVIDKFRVKPPLGQQVMYKVTQDIVATLKNGKVSIPGGAYSFVPAAEYKDLDGQIVSANSQLKFRLPPLSDRSWLEPEAALIEIEYVSHPNSFVLRGFEKALEFFSVMDSTTTVDFLVLKNYWTPVKTGVLKEAISQACREDASISKTDICN